MIGLDRPTRSDLAAFAVYVAAAIVYIAIGVTVIDFLLSFWVAAGYLLVAAWIVPAFVRRLR